MTSKLHLERYPSVGLRFRQAQLLSNQYDDAGLIERPREREIPLHRHGLEATERWSGEARGIGGDAAPDVPQLLL